MVEAAVNVRLSIVLLLVLLLIGGSVYITQELATKEPKESPPWLYQLQSEDITRISVAYREQQMDYELQGDQWVIKDGNDTPVFQDKWAGMTLLLSGPKTNRMLADSIDDPAAYGLDAPQTRIQVYDKSGSPLEFHLGNSTPSGNHWYARVTGSESLFQVAALWGEVVSKLATEPPYTPTPVPPPPTRTPSQETPTPVPPTPTSEPSQAENG